MDNINYDYCFKILIVGDNGVGKSSLLSKLLYNFLPSDNHNNNPPSQSNIGLDFKVVPITINDINVKLQIWDVSNHGRFKTITSSYYRGAQGIIIVYDVTMKTSYDNVTKWITEIDRYALDHVHRLIVGNKCDLSNEKVISTEMTNELSEMVGIDVIEISAKNNFNVKEVFIKITSDIIKYKINQLVPQHNNRLIKKRCRQSCTLI